jgi:hypothetical protein
MILVSARLAIFQFISLNSNDNSNNETLNVGNELYNVHLCFALCVPW